jgi:lipopolysaccharide/colanic/teichoic acid biosynthesis glycosyltransferase
MSTPGVSEGGLATKRAFDVLFSGLGLLALAPVFAFIALWVKLDSPGPVLFRQERVGLAGRSFFIRKFRTMRVNAEAAGLQITVGADARITRAGRYLRASKLDELPQLLDVFQGRMSLVGPRPEVPRYVALYPADVRQRVLSVRPGITDLAAIEYRDEAQRLAQAQDPEREYIEHIMPAKLAISMRYVQTRSLWMDVLIILRTLGVVLGVGAK